MLYPTKMSSAYDDRRAPMVPVSSGSAGGSVRAPVSPSSSVQTLDGVELPAAVFTSDPRLKAAFMRLAPSEVAFFVARPAAEVVRICAALTGVAPQVRAMRDRYFDTADRRLFARGVSVRLRHYTRHTRPLTFEVIAVSWRGARGEGPLYARTNRVLVQTFERSDAPAMAALLAQYRRAGLVEVMRIKKRRTGFELLPVLAECEERGSLAGVDARPIERLDALRVTDQGLRVLVDELHGVPFPEPTIVEVEYDQAHAGAAARLVEQLRSALGPDCLRPKELNKIAYLRRSLSARVRRGERRMSEIDIGPDIDPGARFDPGQQLRIRPEWYRRARPVHRRARVVTPGRLHFQVIDFNKMRPVTPGAGGIGTSTTTACSEVEITVGEGGGGPASVPTAEHLIRLFTRLVGYEGGDLHVSVPARIEHVHSGYGSNVTFNTGVLAGLNAVFGTPFSVPEMWDILTQNFVENSDDEAGKLFWGVDTGVGEAAVLYGGIVWVDEHARYIGSADADGLWLLTAKGDTRTFGNEKLREFGKSIERGVGDLDEFDVTQGVTFDYQAEYGERLLDFLERRMKPYLLRNDARGMLEQGWELNEVGSVVVLGTIWKADVLDAILRTVREAGGIYSTMSSSGPSVFAVCDSEAAAHRVREALEPRFPEYLSNYAVGRAGTRLRVEIDPA
jgi:adenylate cyclase class IV